VLFGLKIRRNTELKKRAYEGVEKKKEMKLL